MLKYSVNLDEFNNLYSVFKKIQKLMYFFKL